MAQVQAITAQLKTTAAQPPEQKAAFTAPEQKTSFDKVSLALHFLKLKKTHFGIQISIFPQI